MTELPTEKWIEAMYRSVIFGMIAIIGFFLQQHYYQFEKVVDVQHDVARVLDKLSLTVDNQSKTEQSIEQRLLVIEQKLLALPPPSTPAPSPLPQLAPLVPFPQHT